MRRIDDMSSTTDSLGFMRRGCLHISFAHTCVAWGADFGFWQAALVIYRVAEVANLDEWVSARLHTLQQGIFQFDVPARVPDILRLSSQSGCADT